MEDVRSEEIVKRIEPGKIVQVVFWDLEDGSEWVVEVDWRDPDLPAEFRPLQKRGYDRDVWYIEDEKELKDAVLQSLNSGMKTMVLAQYYVIG